MILSISDNGLGIDLKRHQNNIFGLYQRFLSNVDGIGLGLFIVKSQVISAGGSIEVNSKVDKGTTFVITWIKRELGNDDLEAKSNNSFKLF